MQIQTTVITTEHLSVQNIPFKVITFEQSVTAFCDCCCASAHGKETELKRQGWHMGAREQFCPECNG